MRYYPIFLDLRGRRCAVVGGGRVAERKVRALLQAGARVHVISPALTPRLALLAARKKIDLTPRAYRSGDLDGTAPARTDGSRGVPPTLVFAATNDPETQRAVRKHAEQIGALVNTADEAKESDFIVPASFAQGDLLVAISTSGASPALARRLRRQLQVTLGREYRGYSRFLREARKQVMDTVPDEAHRAKILRQLSGAPMLDWLSKGPPARAALDVKKWLARVVGPQGTD
ncbi:MAG: bifunctional precorrin-2 dehydrogenase/sirohydrochlorin ferrochelatase [Terriglobia bacterium]